MKQPFLPLVVLARVGAVLPGQDQAELVDPAIGGVGFLLEPTRPIVPPPNNLVRVYPVRNRTVV